MPYSSEPLENAVCPRTCSERDLFFRYCISGLIWLGMLEMGVWYFDFSAYNASGTRPEAVTLVAISLHVAKKAVRTAHAISHRNAPHCAAARTTRLARSHWILLQHTQRCPC